MLELDDVLLVNGEVKAAPAWSVNFRDDWFLDGLVAIPIEAEWHTVGMHITEIRNRNQLAWVQAQEQRLAAWEDLKARVVAGDELAKTEFNIKLQASKASQTPLPEHENVLKYEPKNAPTMPFFGHVNVWVCSVCSQSMMSVDARIRVCSTKCDRKRRNATRVSRAKERQPVTCGTCAEVFKPKRADARYCSLRCRVAAHRGAPKA